MTTKKSNKRPCVRVVGVEYRPGVRERGRPPQRPVDVESEMEMELARRRERRMFGRHGWVSARKRLQHVMGQRCWRCGAVEDLTFDCVDAAMVLPHSNQPGHVRMRLYWREFVLGNLQLLCRGCNTRKGRRCERYEAFRPQWMNWGDN